MRTAPFVALFGIALLSSSGRAIECPGDFDGDGSVGVSEVVWAVRSSLYGCPLPGPRFVDNLDGTITDNATGLMWEKKLPGFDCLHCGRRWFLWDEAAGEWLSRVNGAPGCTTANCVSPQPQGGLAGYSDWRLPSIAEWKTIIDTCPPVIVDGDRQFPSACLKATLGLPDADWWLTNSVHETEPDAVWIVDFSFGGVVLQRGSRVGSAPNHARAVRTIR